MRRPLHTDEGGSGYTSGDPSKTRWANWATAYVKYCDGGSMTGTREDSTPQRNGSSGPLWCKCCRRLELLPAFLTSSSNPCTDRGKYNLDAQLEHMVAAHSLKTFDRIILSGCSAGGMACYIHCDYVHDFFAPIDVKCICDAGIFLDVETVTGAGNVMQQRYHDIADVMESKPGLSKACVAAVRAPPRTARRPAVPSPSPPLWLSRSVRARGQEDDWRQCIFSQYAIQHMQTPTFLINSLYNFGAWEMLAPSEADTGTVPADWAKCWPKNGALSPESFKQVRSGLRPGPWLCLWLCL